MRPSMRYGFRPRLSWLLLLFLVASSSFGWGENAERLIVNKAVDTLPAEMLPFFQANRPIPGAARHRPAESEAKNPSERAQRFHPARPLRAVSVRESASLLHRAVAKFGRRSVEAYGLLPWQIGLYSKKLTDAFRTHNWTEAKLSAAILAHYVAAAHDPFNTTMNSDGKLSAQPGVNERFGTGLVDRYQLFLLREAQ